MMQILIIQIVSTYLAFTFPNYDGFEGVVSFELSYSNADQRLSEGYLCVSSGDSIVYYHSNHGYIEKFYCEGELIQRRWFDGKDNKLYMKSESDDTLYYYYANETDYSAEVEKTETIEMVIGYNCQKVTVNLIPKHGKDLPELRYDYFISTDIKINPVLFGNFTEGGYSEVSKVIPGLILKQVYYGPYYTRTRRATELKHLPVEIKDHKPAQSGIMKRL